MSAQKKKGMSLGKMGTTGRGLGATQPLEVELGDGEDTILVVDANGEVSEVPSPKKVPSKGSFKTPPKLTRAKRGRSIGIPFHLSHLTTHT
jgi:hypothetical protein